MEEDNRKALFDQDWEIEVYHFCGIMQKLPNHFHEHYVLGFIESGYRFLQVKNRDYTVNEGDLLLFNPLENHTCVQIDDRALDWRCINIEKSVMERMTKEITGKNYLPIFTSTVISGSDALPLLKDLHRMIMERKNHVDVGGGHPLYVARTTDIREKRKEKLINKLTSSMPLLR